MHFLITLKHERGRKKARTCYWKKDHHKPAKRNKRQTIYKHSHNAL